MKRMHLHVSVDDLDKSIAFYSTLFGAEPAVTKPDYAKWMLEDPRVNFAISARGVAAGVDHIGIQVDEREELAILAQRLKAAGETTFDEEATTCCYAHSDKSWVNDPSGLRWETFYTFGDATSYGEDKSLVAAAPAAQACCAPRATEKACC
ncbi:MAG TPA: ArsI/CadI family heavy metal resistance metalloenzyme [Caulobacterales bacterium]|nr:ArsI/CadI family heavy metal resistance metalloenzyme [Caulobacterales bacterium]